METQLADDYLADLRCQAAQLNQSRNLNVRAFVLDCTIRSSAQRNT